MDSVAKKNNRRDVHRSLASFPQKLNDTYDEVMRRISSQSQEDIDLAERLLEWVVCAKRPLKLIEVQHALAVEEGDVDLDEDGIPDEDLMVFACAGLVTVDLDSTVRLVHRTAQEYFEQILAARFPRAQINITSTCLTYLSFDAMYAENCPGNELKDQLERYPLTAYAVQWWGEHARGEPEVPLKESIISFLKNDSKVVVWYRISNYLRRAYDSPLPSLSQVVGLHIAARFGLSRVVGSLISASDVNARDSSGETPLHWAARYGQETVVKELLNQPSCIADAISHRGRTPLSFAAANGHAGVVSLLLQRQDVDADAKDPFFGESPLWKAVDQGHEAVVRLLLGHPNVDVNCQNIPWGQTPLWRATDNVHTAIVSLLLQRADVDVNANDSIYAQTPLQRATADGNVAIVELLLRHPVIDVIAADRPGGQLNMTIRLSSLDHPALSCS
jgi:ankyrin repeat protein